MCVIVGQLEEIQKIVRRVDQLRRWTRLGDLFRSGADAGAGVPREATRHVQQPAPTARPAQPVDLSDVLAGWTF